MVYKKSTTTSSLQRQESDVTLEHLESNTYLKLTLSLTGCLWTYSTKQLNTITLTKHTIRLLKIWASTHHQYLSTSHILFS